MMDKMKQKAIEHHNAALMDSMNPLVVMDNLCACLLSVVEKEFINESNLTRRDRNRELLSILFRKREELEPFECFVEALNKTDASHEVMAKAILKTYNYGNGVAVFEKVSRTSLSDDGENKYELQT
uniref:CARD domain-containing protein n=1 Tax=Plectus sambesii TaxID=2011161 RepID=A0A914V7W8_9BILA